MTTCSCRRSGGRSCQKAVSFRTAIHHSPVRGNLYHAIPLLQTRKAESTVFASSKRLISSDKGISPEFDVDKCLHLWITAHAPVDNLAQAEATNREGEGGEPEKS